MTAAGTWLFPPGRALAGWWRELSPRLPQRLWFTHLLLHRVEALAEVTHTRRPDALLLSLLRMSADPAALDQLRVDRQLLSQWLNDLAAHGLLRRQGQGWQLTDAGRTAVATGAYSQPGRERRSFYFVDQGEASRPAQFLSLARPALPYPTTGPDFWFDPRWLQECPHRPPDWKRAHQFPADVLAVVGVAAATDPAPLSWREVVLDRPEYLPAAVIRTADGIEGYQAQTETWKLLAQEPIFSLAECWEGVLPDLAVEPLPELWRAAWLAWCRQRSLPPAEKDACSLERRDQYLEVRLPKRFIDRLKAARSEVLHGETWLLAGTGRTREAALVRILEGET